MNRLIIIAVAAVVMVPAGAGETINRSSKADPAGEIEISNVSGLIEVTGWDRDEIRVTGELGDNVDGLEYETSGDYTRIKVIIPENERSVDSSDLEISVPRNSHVTIGTVEADIEVGGVRGSQRIQSVSGEIEVEIWDEDVEIKTVSGDLDVTGNNGGGRLTLAAVSSDVRVDGISGEIVAHTVSGDIEVEAGKLSRLKLNTTNGDMEIAATIDEGARFSVETINGDLALKLNGGLNAKFDVQTVNGDIENCFGPEPIKTHRFMPGRELRFTEGDGKAQVTIKTLNGDIELCND